MSNITTKLSLVCMAAALLFSQQVQVASAHPGHSLPEQPDARVDCGGCNDDPGVAQTSQESRSEADGNSGEELNTKPARMAADAKNLMQRMETTQRKVATLSGRISQAHEVVRQTGKLSASFRRQILRSLRSARRTNERLARELGAFVDLYSGDLSVELQNQLNAELAKLNGFTSLMSEQEASLKGARGCSADQCSEVIQTVYDQGNWSGEGTSTDGLTKILGSLDAAEAPSQKDL